MARKFANPVNNHIESVDIGSSVAAFFLGAIYLAYKGLWSHVFIWILVVVVPGMLSAVLLFMAVPIVSLLYCVAIQRILAERYLRQGWHEVRPGGTYEDRDLAAATAAILAMPDPMLPRTVATAKPVETKLCPYCAEEVRLAAVKCKHCQSDLSAAA